MLPHRYAYLHGFASSARSTKGVALAARFAAIGIELELPDLNRPSFAALSHDAMLAALDAMDDPRRPWRFIGSSLGGWLAARWAALHPERIDRLVLLCPGFHLEDRWPAILGAEKWARWERDGALALEDATKDLVEVHWGFIEEARRQPKEPSVPCPTVIVHGTADTIVPIETSRAYVAARPDVRLVEVEDDHSLGRSIDRVFAEACAHFGRG